MNPLAPLTDARIYAQDGTRPRHGGEFVLYWMQLNLRAHDNFALNVAARQANELGLPLLVYHSLRHDYPWASDRIHTFILESVADLWPAFERRGIQYAFYLDQRTGPGVRWAAGNRPDAPADGRSPAGPPVDEFLETSPLLALADRAALVVADWFPTFIMPRHGKTLRERTRTPVVLVDASLAVPSKMHLKEHLTARGIRPFLMSALEEHLHPVGDVEPRVRTPVALPFEPLRPTAETISALVASCDIDHAVEPSPIFRGGTTAARTRLHWWLEHGLPRYDERNDPNVDVTSRMSPYLHFGNLSVQEILLAAREAGPPARYEKFLDETVTWREISFNFCAMNPHHRTAAAIPAWAQAELKKHEADPRPELYTDEELEYARTGDDLWNAAQVSYLRDGWMHNYMRMLWGKAVLQWTPDAAHCLRVLEHLNNKYSLDGRDPCSYGGIMWTFGKFDRPFYRRPIYGTVRFQSLKTARDKFDVPAYVRRFLGARPADAPRLL